MPSEMSEELYFDLDYLGYNLPLRHADYAQDVIRRLSSIVSQEHFMRALVPGQRLAWNLRMATNLAEIALMQSDSLTAFSSAQYHDSIHPIDKMRGWERLSDRVVEEVSIPTFAALGIDMAALPEVSEA